MARVSLLSVLGLAKAQATPCEAGVTTRNVTSTADALELSDALRCSGPAEFEIDWVGEALLTRTIAVSNGSSVKVMGRGAGEAVIDGGGAVRLFEVNEGSTLELNRVSLVGGFSSGDGGAVHLAADSRLSVVNCSFVENIASNNDIQTESSTSSSSGFYSSEAWAGGGGLFNLFTVTPLVSFSVNPRNMLKVKVRW